MAGIATLWVDLEFRDGDGSAIRVPPRRDRWAIGTGSVGQRQTVTVTASTFTALTVPTGAKFVAILLGSATGLTLKGVTGDTGVTLTPTSSPIGVDLMMPLGATPSIGLASSKASDQTVEVLFG